MFDNTRFTHENILSLKENEIFVFASNRSGRHGLGAAKLALQKFGAIYGRGEGLMGQCYALPTKGYKMEVLSLDDIRGHIAVFLNVARQIKDKYFLVTKIGCGLAGYKPSDIAPLFFSIREKDYTNICLPEEFWKYAKF